MYLPVLTYHRILSEAPTVARDPKRIAVSAHQFRSHLKWLSRLGYKSVDATHYARNIRYGGTVARKTFAITFDDGYKEVFTLGLPILREFGFTATVFAVAEELGGTNSWDDGQARLMTVDQYNDWARAGMAIGAHSCRHKHLPEIKDDDLLHEIHESKKLLETRLNRPVPTFAYPYGESDERVEAFVKEAGFEAAFATDRAPRNHAASPYRIRRVVVFPKNSAWDIWKKIQPWYPAYQDRRRRD